MCLYVSVRNLLFWLTPRGCGRPGVERSSMETVASPAASHAETLGIRLRNAAMGGLFAVVLLLPKVLHIRRDERSWTAFRILLGIAGAGLVVLPLAIWNSWFAGIAGLAMFLTAALLPPAKPDTLVDDKAKELAALVVVNGGKYQPGTGPATCVRLFVGAANIWALNSHLHPLLRIPVAGITSALAEEMSDGWVVRVRWADRMAEFSYAGIFAEHLARVAESTIGSVMPSSLPILPRSRAANA